MHASRVSNWMSWRVDPSQLGTRQLRDRYCRVIRCKTRRFSDDKLMVGGHWVLHNSMTANIYHIYIIYYIYTLTKLACKHTAVFISLVVNTYEMQLLFSSMYRWWRHQMETFSALLALCAGHSPVPDEFPTQRPVTRSFYVFFDLSPTVE